MASQQWATDIKPRTIKIISKSLVLIQVMVVLCGVDDEGHIYLMDWTYGGGLGKGDAIYNPASRAECMPADVVLLCTLKPPLTAPERSLS